MLIQKRPLIAQRTEATKQKLFQLSVKKEDFESVLIDSIHLWKDNPRINEPSVPTLAKTFIENGGQVSPIVVWRKNKVIYKGNTTWKAMKYNKAKSINVLWVDFPSEAAAIAYGIADNKASEGSSWDEKLLNKFLNSKEINFSATGFTETERRFLTMGASEEKINAINGKHSNLKDKVVVLIVDHSAREGIVDLLKNWISTTGLKNIEVQK